MSYLRDFITSKKLIMNRYIFILFLLITGFIFNGCDKDEDEENACLLEGSWDAVYAEMDGDCAWYCDNNASVLPSSCDGEVYAYDQCLTLVFNSDGSFATSNSYDGETYAYSGTWSGDCNAGDSVTIVIDGDTTIWNIVSISSNSLQISYNGGTLALSK